MPVVTSNLMTIDGKRLAIPDITAIDSTTDFNSIVGGGWYGKLLGGAAGSRNANHPDGQTPFSSAPPNGVVNYYYLLVANYSSNVTQIAVPYLSGADTSSVTIKMRNFGGGVWSPWKSIQTSENTFGVGQTWQGVKASRNAGTTYTNSTGKPIFVAVTIVYSGGASSAGTLVVNGVTVSSSAATGLGGTSFNTPLTAIVPPGGTYLISGLSGATINFWAELR